VKAIPEMRASVEKGVVDGPSLRRWMRKADRIRGPCLPGERIHRPKRRSHDNFDYLSQFPARSQYELHAEAGHIVVILQMEDHRFRKEPKVPLQHLEGVTERWLLARYKPDGAEMGQAALCRHS